MFLNLIGDIHGNFDVYKNIVSKSEYSIQLGDFGMYNTWKKLKEHNIDSNFHKILPGNHDDYSWIEYNNPLHNLGDFGSISIKGTDLFFVRGGDSIDKDFRIQERDWWPQEIMSYDKLNKCVFEYQQKRPDIVISHSNPDSVLETFLGVTNHFTNSLSKAFDYMLEYHRPKLWIFAHLHPLKTSAIIVNGTCFVCVSIKSYISYNLDKSILYNVNNLYKQHYYENGE